MLNVMEKDVIDYSSIKLYRMVHTNQNQNFIQRPKSQDMDVQDVTTQCVRTAMTTMNETIEQKVQLEVKKL